MRLALAAATAAVLLSAAAPPASAQVARTEKEQAPGVFRMQLGDVLVTALSDGTVAQDLHAVMTNTSPAEVDELLHRSFLANPVEASINAYLLDTGSRLLLVDTGAGRLFGPGNGGRLVERLAAAGYRPDEVDDILLTHVHTDHSGGLTDGGRLVFPDATVHAGQADLDLFLDPANAAKAADHHKRLFAEAEATVRPYVLAGKVKGFSGRTELFPGITAVPTPGHTPGHAFFRVESRGEAIDFWGDIIHFGSVQFPRPAITVAYDNDARAAANQRAAQFREAARERRLVAGAHLNFPGIGRIRADAGGYAWVPVEYRDRSTVRLRP